MSTEYTIRVTTDGRLYAGTKAKVYITLNGKDAVSKELELVNPSGAAFDRGAVSTFSYNAEEEFGNLESIRIRHDNSGDLPGWLLNDIFIQNMETLQAWTFGFKCWLDKYEPPYYATDVIILADITDDIDWKINYSYIDYDEPTFDPALSRKITIAESIINNPSSVEIEQKFSAKKSKGTTFEYSFKETLMLELSQELKIEVPDIASVTHTIKLTAGLEAGQRWESTTNEEYAIENTVKVPAKHSVSAKASVDWVDDLHIPFEMFFFVKANYKHDKQEVKLKELEKILRKNGFSGTIIERHENLNEFLVSIKGDLTGSWGVTTSLSVTDIIKRDELGVENTVTPQASARNIITPQAI